MLGQTRQIRLLSTLGEGGFGAVYLAEIAGSDGFVQRAALKVLHKQMAGHGDVAGRQRDEARLLAQLNHDHIVKVLDLGDFDGRPAVLMEYVEGVDTHGLLQQGPLPPRVVLEITAAVASALDAASTARSPSTGRPLNVVHRDIKPANILVTAQGGVKVLDFGVARADFDREGATKSVLFGTARFMAPEMWLDGSSGAGVDVYALGVTTWELLGSGAYTRPPLHPDLYAKHVEDALAVVRLDADPRWLSELCELLRAMLAYEIRDRPGAASVHDRALELAERAPGLALRRWARQAVPPILAERARCAVTPLIARPPPSTHFTPAEAPSPGAQRRSAVPVALGETSPVGAEREAVPELLSDPPVENVAFVEPVPSSAPTLAPITETAIEAARAEGDGPPSASLATTTRRRSYVLPAMLSLAAGVGVVWWGGSADPTPTSPEPVVVDALMPSSDPPTEIPTAPAAPADVVVPVGEPAATPAEASVPATSSPPAAPSRARTKPATAETSSNTTTSESAPVPPTTLACATSPGRVPVDLSSTPLGADVWANGSRLGSTPLFDCGLPEDSLRVTMKFQGKSTTHEIRVSSRAAKGFVWDVEADRWIVDQ